MEKQNQPAKKKYKKKESEKPSVHECAWVKRICHALGKSPESIKDFLIEEGLVNEEDSK